MEHSNIQAAVEAVLFASGEPVESEKLCEAVGIVKDQLEEALGSLADKYSKAESGITLLSLNGSYQLATKEELATFIKAALEIKKNSVLSPAAMETLTIVAYNQPVTKGFVEHVRGVDSSGVVNSLVDKGLLAEAGRLDLPGMSGIDRHCAEIDDRGIHDTERRADCMRRETDPEKSL